MSEVKPDFEAIAMAHARTNYSGTATSDYVMKVSFHTGKVLMEHVWSSHVEPLQKEKIILVEHKEQLGIEVFRLQQIETGLTLERDKLKESVDKLVHTCIKNSREDGDEIFKLNQERYELQSEISRLNLERDSFAIGFAKWIDKGPYFLHGLTTWKSVDVREPIITDNELIDLYKETLKT